MSLCELKHCTSDMLCEAAEMSTALIGCWLSAASGVISFATLALCCASSRPDSISGTVSKPGLVSGRGLAVGDDTASTLLLIQIVAQVYGLCQLELACHFGSCCGLRSGSRPGLPSGSGLRCASASARRKLSLRAGRFLLSGTHVHTSGCVSDFCLPLDFAFDDFDFVFSFISSPLLLPASVQGQVNFVCSFKQSPVLPGTMTKSPGVFYGRQCLRSRHGSAHSQ